MNRDVCEHFNPVNLPCAKCAVKTKSEVLQLADFLDDPRTVVFFSLRNKAAAELRRLHAQRDALLEFAKYVEAIDPGNPAPLFEKAREAIAKAEGQ